MSKEPNRAKKIIRWVRFGCMGLCLLLVYFMLNRFQIWNMDQHNNSMVPAYPAGSRLLVDYEPRPPSRTDVVIYEYRGKGRTARVAALGGDRLEVRGGILVVGGVRSVHRIKTDSSIPAIVPPGHLYLLNDNPNSSYPDCLSHGPVPASRVRARVLTKLDFF